MYGVEVTYMGADSRVEEDYRLLGKGCGLVFPYSDEASDPIGRLGLVEVTGADRMEWLQGQATNDLRNTPEGEPVDFCVCAPTGQMIADCRMWAFSDLCLIQTPRACVPALLERIEKMVIMEEVEARESTAAWRHVSIQGKGADDLTERIALEWASEGPFHMLKSDHTGLGGWDLFLPERNADAFLQRLSGETAASLEAILALRLEFGIPYFGVDMDARTLPPEMGPRFENAHVSYTKGCYTGQEVIARIHSRGHTNRTWVGLHCDAPVSAGDKVSSEAREDAGAVTSAALSPRLGPIAATMLRNEAADEGAEVFVVREGERVKARVEHFPLGG